MNSCPRISLPKLATTLLRMKSIISHFIISFRNWIDFLICSTKFTINRQALLELLDFVKKTFQTIDHFALDKKAFKWVNFTN